MPSSLLNIRGVSMPKEKALELGPNLGVCPMLAQDIRWVGDSRDMVEFNHTGSNGFTDSVERQDGMSFMKLGVNLGRTFCN